MLEVYFKMKTAIIELRNDSKIRKEATDRDLISALNTFKKVKTAYAVIVEKKGVWADTSFFDMEDLSKQHFGAISKLYEGVTPESIDEFMNRLVNQKPRHEFLEGIIDSI